MVIGAVEGANEVVQETTHKDFPAWEQGASRVLYCLASYVHDQMLGYISHTKTQLPQHENCSSGKSLIGSDKDICRLPTTPP